MWIPTWTIPWHPDKHLINTVSIDVSLLAHLIWAEMFCHTPVDRYEYLHVAGAGSVGYKGHPLRCHARQGAEDVHTRLRLCQHRIHGRRDSDLNGIQDF